MNTLLLAAVVLFTAPFQSDTDKNKQQVSSNITQATVFLSGAQVHRTAEVELSKGLNYITFSGLSNTLNEESISISTDKQITLLSLSKEIAKSESTAKLDSLRNLLETIENDINLKNAEQKVLEYELNILLDNKDLKGENDKISAAELKQAMAFFKEKLTEIEKGKIEVQNKIASLNKRRSEINQQINEIVRQQNRTSAQIATEIESPSAGTVTVQLSYLVPGAGWSPKYDVRVNDISDPMQMSYKADIYQNTGVDWDNVQLSVSSAEPRSSTRLPYFRPDYLSFYTAEGKKIPPPSRADAKEVIELDAGLSRNRMTAPETSISQNLTSFSFDIQVPYSIKGDGSRKTVTVQKHALEADYRYYAIPKEQEEAYLTAQLTDWEELNLLPGQMNLYFDQTFVGRSTLQPSTPGDTLMFSLGKDNAITVERERVKEFSEKNFFGNKVRETSGWRLSVKNNKNEPITLELIDQIPVSTNEDIQVSVGEKSGAIVEKETGKVTWILNITPGQAVQKELRYEIEYPSGKEIQREK
ncbi:MAG: mucoidy inhibitor MuiA family protein [Balneolaceae bacterium]|nr:mucoidy inhibitor MuiA family protein [Balneolaceae bacterium]